MKNKKLPFFFEEIIREYPDKVISALTDEEGMLLTEIVLAKNKELFVQSDTAKALFDKGMIERKDGEIAITEIGEKAISMFPLLGEKERRLAYPAAFFPFILFEIASGKLPSGRWQKIISSDFFTSLFPGVASSRIKDAGIKAIERLLDLSVAIDNGTELTLDRKAAEAFMKLSEEERIALMDEGTAQLENKALFVFIASLLSGIHEDEIDEKLGLAKELSLASIDKSILFLFSVLEEKDGIITGRKMENSKTEGFTVSSDFSITYRGSAPEDIYLYAEPVLSDATSEWKLTRLSMKTAFSSGFTPESVKQQLSFNSKFLLPETLLPRISGWYESWNALKAERAIILRADERNARIIDALPTLKMHILGKIGENAFIMDPETEELWRRALQNAGFDMLGTTTGPLFQKKAERNFPLPPRQFNAPEIPEERKIPFDRAERERLLSSTADPWRRILIKSGIIADESIPSPLLDTVNGLYYQEKMRLINHAIAEKQKLYLEFVDGTVLTGLAEKEEDNLIIAGKEAEADKVWKAAVLPFSVIDSAEPLLDSDTL